MFHNRINKTKEKYKYKSSLSGGWKMKEGEVRRFPSKGASPWLYVQCPFIFSRSMYQNNIPYFEVFFWETFNCWHHCLFFVPGPLLMERVYIMNLNLVTWLTSSSESTPLTSSSSFVGLSSIGWICAEVNRGVQCRVFAIIIEIVLCL